MLESHEINNDLIYIVQNPRRRYFIKALIDLDGEASLRELVRRIAKTIGNPGDKKLVKSIYISMIQNHIPKMERVGLIKYDRLNGTVYLLKLPQELRYYLYANEDMKNEAWNIYYLTLSIAGIITSLILKNYLAGMISICFLVISIFHLSQSQGLLS